MTSASSLFQFPSAGADTGWRWPWRWVEFQISDIMVFSSSLTAVASTTQRECSFGGGAEGITKQLQRIRVSFLLDNKVGPRERRESLWSLQIRFTWKSMRKLRQLWLVDTVFVSLFELIEASHRVHTANEVNCHAVLHARRVFHFILLKTIHSQQSKAVTIYTKLHSMATKQQQLPIG